MSYSRDEYLMDVHRGAFSDEPECPYCDDTSTHPEEAPNVCPLYESADLEDLLDAQERAKEEASR